MDLVILILGLALIGCLVFFITTKIPMDATIAWLIRLVVVIAIALYVIRRFSGSVPNVLN